MIKMPTSNWKFKLKDPYRRQQHLRNACSWWRSWPHWSKVAARLSSGGSNKICASLKAWGLPGYCSWLPRKGVTWTRKSSLVTLTLGDYLTVNVFPVRVTKNFHRYTLGTYGLSHQSYRTQRESAIKSKRCKKLQNKTLASRHFVWWVTLEKLDSRLGRCPVSKMVI